MADGQAADTGEHRQAPTPEQREPNDSDNSDITFLKHTCRNREVGWSMRKDAVLQEVRADLINETHTPGGDTSTKQRENNDDDDGGGHIEQRTHAITSVTQRGQALTADNRSGSAQPNITQVNPRGQVLTADNRSGSTQPNITQVNPRGQALTADNRSGSAQPNIDEGEALTTTAGHPPTSMDTHNTGTVQPIQPGYDAGGTGKYGGNSPQGIQTAPPDIVNIGTCAESQTRDEHKTLATVDMTMVKVNNELLRNIYNKVVESGDFNYRRARLRLPSGLNMVQWRKALKGYPDSGIVEFLEYGWPIGIDRAAYLQSYNSNHTSARLHPADVEHYIVTELGHRALLGPFGGPPTKVCHFSPLMTRTKRDSIFRRVIIDLSWPKGWSVNDGISRTDYIDGPMTISLPTPDDMERAVVRAGRGSFLYKTDLSRGYRQLRVDPLDWPLLSFRHGSMCFMDICPPFGLRSSAMAMQRVSQAIVHLHGRRGFLSCAYIDDFGGVEGNKPRATEALGTLQGIMDNLGVVQAAAKICPPSQVMIWLGIFFDTKEMYMAIPQEKLTEIMACLESWRGRDSATRKEMQSLLGLLNFVASVAPPTRLFTNRMLDDLRETSHTGHRVLTQQFQQDVQFFLDLLPMFNGRRMMGKQLLPYQHQVELDACLSGCGAVAGDQFYAAQFPESVTEAAHTIAHLELLNVVVAIKMWSDRWSGWTVQIYCDNLNTVCVLQSGRSRDNFMRACAREVFLLTAAGDIDIQVCHRPGLSMIWADALSREHTHPKFAKFVREDPHLAAATRRTVPPELFVIRNKL